MSEAAQTIAGRYRIERKLGEGGMGVVYACVDDAGRRFAVKLIHREIVGQDPAAIPRFMSEARAGAKITDPHVVSVVDSGVDRDLGVPYLAMELLAGEDAEALRQRVGALHPVVATRIVLQAARGLAAAHAHGIVHRDVKPANLFLERAGAQIRVRVCDFGIAKSFEGSHGMSTDTGTILGSPLYMSPEQAKSAKHVDERTDVWSLGVTLYQLLTGNATPFATRASFAELVLVICTQDPRHVQDAAPWVDPALAVVLHGALIRDRDARYPTVAAFADALERHAAGTTELELAHLVGIDASLREYVASRAELPTRAVLRAPDDEVDPLVGRTLGRYRLERRLGRGGMGAVYEATSPDGRRVALKVILEGDARASPDARRRFVREARSTASVRGAHVVEILDADVDEATGTPYLAMELLKGTDLDHWIAQLGPLPPEIAARVFVQACRGLAVAHAKGIVHRDIKPANLFLAEDAQGGVTVKVCDFGIAKSTATDGLDPTTAALTKTGGMLGSPIYMSPEQARNAKQVDARSDVWSLCISMHEALAGARPWSHCTTIGELILGICTEDVQALRGLAPWVDEKLAEVVHHGLARPSDQRWPDMTSLERALAPFAGDAQLTREMLKPLPPHLRSAIDPNAATMALAGASRTTAATARAASASVPASTSSTGAIPRRGAMWSAVALVVVALVGGVAYTQLRGRGGATTTASSDPAVTASASSGAASSELESEKPSAAPPASISTSVAVAVETAHVTIVPPEAKVTVDGVASALVDGVLTLGGDPGAELHVVVTAYGRSVDQIVVLAKGGLAHPDKIVVAKAGSASVAPVKANASTKTNPTGKPTETAPAPPTAAPSLTIKEGL